MKTQIIKCKGLHRILRETNSLFYFGREGNWCACQNIYPYELEMVLSREMIGNENMELKVATR